MRYTLHLFPFSNFCEKARWALDYLGVEYEIVTHYPGPHARAIKKLSGQTAVPVLEDGGKVIAGSSKIIQHVMVQENNFALVPEEHSDEIEQWLVRFDKVGATLRGVLFHTILPNPKLAIGVLTTGQKSYWSGYGMFFRTMIPLFKKMLRKNLPSAEKAQQKCLETLLEIAEASKDTGYLVGDQFTLADLTAAAIFYPICMPDNATGSEYAKEHPELEVWFQKWSESPAIPYIDAIYSNYRLARINDPEHRKVFS